MNSLLPSLALVTLATISASSAHAAPWGGADCVAAAAADLHGATISAKHTDDAGTTTNHLAFEPKSFFVADGYAVKVFAGENFTGTSELDGDPTSLNELTKTDGGRYVNVGDRYVSEAKSFACVPAGKLWTDAKAFHQHYNGTDTAIPVVYYPGQNFSGDEGYHGQSGSISLDEKSGHKILTFSNSFYYANGSSGTIDLDSGAITYNVIDGAYPHDVLSTQVITQTPGIKGIDFQYKGALDSVLSILDLVISNPTTNSPSGNEIKVPNLELNSIRSLLQTALGSN